MNVKEKIDALSTLGDELKQKPQWLEEAIQRAYLENAWFTPENSWNSIISIANEFLSKDKLIDWTNHYNIPEDVSQKTIGLILAGNLPLVGFHDVLCVLLSGHKAMIKMSSKDQILVERILGRLMEIEPAFENEITFVERLGGFDAVIATGSNNSSRYFESYFEKYPNIIRKNRTSVAVLTGDETDEDLIELGKDIFSYYGLGCRNVSKIYAPVGFEVTRLMEVLHNHYKEIVNHNKYMNNYDYNYALFMLNKEKFLMNGGLLLRESSDFTSRIASVNIEYYSKIEQVEKDLLDNKGQLQCVVSKKDLGDIQTFELGKAQEPELMDYADGVDTMAFLMGL